MRWIELGLLAVGLVCLMWASAISIQAVTYQVRQNARLARLAPASEPPVPDSGPYLVAASSEVPTPIGRLEIPRLGVSAVVMEGDDENTLQVAVGHLPDTPLPWQDGNAALAGHRDTFLRPLRRIRAGDDIRLETPHGTFRYRATRHMVVEPHELWVLDPSPTAALTLITCYPFHFVGPAPQRFVVHAERVGDTPEALQTSAAQQGDAVR